MLVLLLYTHYPCDFSICFDEFNNLFFVYFLNTQHYTYLYHDCVNVEHVFDEPLITYINVLVSMVICNILVMWSFLVICESLTALHMYPCLRAEIRRTFKTWWRVHSSCIHVYCNKVGSQQQPICNCRRWFRREQRVNVSNMCIVTVTL